MLDAYREIIHALVEQRRDVTWEIPRDWVPPVEPTGQGSAKELRVATTPGSGKPMSGRVPSSRPASSRQSRSMGRLMCFAGRSTAHTPFMDGLCTHGRALLSDGFLDDCILECPKHNGRFDVTTGQAVRLPAQKPLAHVPRHRTRRTARGLYAGKRCTPRRIARWFWPERSLMQAVRDYSLLGEDSRRAARVGSRNGGLVQVSYPAQKNERTDATSRWPGYQGYDYLAGVDGGRRRSRVLSLVFRLVSFAIRYLWGSLLCGVFPVARVRSRHRLQDALDEQRCLQPRQLHGDARPDDVALEPYSPSHRYNYRWPGREIVAMRPPVVARIVLNLFGLVEVPTEILSMFVHASGRLSDEDASYVPKSERSKIYWTARAWLLIYAGVIAACFAFRSILPACSSVYL